MKITVDKPKQVWHTIFMMKATKVLAKFTNEEDRIEVVVAEITNGFSVVLHDIDSDEYFPEILLFKTEEAAIAKAKNIYEEKA